MLTERLRWIANEGGQDIDTVRPLSVLQGLVSEGRHRCDDVDVADELF